MKYSSRNKIKFTSISDKYAIDVRYKARQCELHSTLIYYVMKNYRDTSAYREKVVRAVNLITYSLLNNEAPPFDWKVDNPLDTMPDIDEDEIKASLGDIYLTQDCIEWDVVPSSNFVEAVTEKSPKLVVQTTPIFNVVSIEASSQKEDLYLKPPVYPQFDISTPWLSMQDGPDKLVIYTTLPKIPTKQNEISLTTNVNGMTDYELMNLYPKSFIRTRAAILYERVDGLDFDDELGCIIPVKGYSKKQLIDNLIKYPHFYKLKKQTDEGIASFYQTLEVKGELVPIADIWDSLPESKVIPKQSEFIKEYVVRRYLLERDNGVDHKYKMYGTLNPYLTLFMPSENYIRRGYTDTLKIVKDCVRARVSFKQSRNPILRRLNLNV